MILVKILLVFCGICCLTEATVVSNIPIVGTVFDTITNASKDVINSAIGTVQHDTAMYADFINEKIKEMLEKFRELMVDKIDILGLPRLEPLDINHIDIDITHEIGIFKGTMDRVKISNLSKFKLDGISTKGLTTLEVTLNLSYDDLIVFGEYDLQADVGDLFHVFGAGPFNLIMRELKIDVDITIKINLIKQTITVDKANVEFSMKNMTCEFENLMGGGESGDLFNKVIGQLAPEAIDVLWPEIKPIVSQKIKEQGNETLKKIPFKDIIAILFPTKLLRDLGM